MMVDPRVNDPKVAINVQIPAFRPKEVVVEQQARSLVILIQILDPLSLLENAGLNTIPLSRESPHPISNSGRIPHHPR